MMAKLSDLVANNVGIEVASKLIQEGSVKVNGVINQSDDFVYVYDVVEFNDKKLCYLGADNIIEDEYHSH